MRHQLTNKSVTLLAATLCATVGFSPAFLPAQTGAAATGCDASLWKHVYNPSRLKKVTSCVTVTGIVEESSTDDDGDQHFLLKLDKGQKDLANKRNRKKKGGDVVVEIVCANPVRLPKARSACAGYTNRITIPKVGDRVSVTGSYVIDSHNGWAEVHPVSKLEIL